MKLNMDKIELKAVQDESASYAALVKKAEIYNKIMRGEISDGKDEEKYCVDFFKKGLEHSELELPQRTDITLQAQDIDEDDGFMLDNTKAAGLGRASATVVRSRANQAREKVSKLKMCKQEQVASRREKLKQAYLRKQLEKLKLESI